MSKSRWIKVTPEFDGAFGRILDTVIKSSGAGILPFAADLAVIQACIKDMKEFEDEIVEEVKEGELV